MHKSLANKIRKRIKNARVVRAYYASERNDILKRVAEHFNSAFDFCHEPTEFDADTSTIDTKFWGCLPTGDQFLHKWDTDYNYRRKLVVDDINTFFDFWKQQGKIPNWMRLYEDDYETLKSDFVDVIVSRFEEGIQRAKECKKNIVPAHYKFHDDDFFCTHIDAHTLWIYYGYYTYQRYWMRTIEPSANGMAV